jgi:hypothetical protein
MTIYFYSRRIKNSERFIIMSAQSTEEMVKNNNLVYVTDCETGDKMKFLVKGFNNPFYGKMIGNNVTVGSDRYVIEGIIAQ